VVVAFSTAVLTRPGTPPPWPLPFHDGDRSPPPRHSPTRHRPEEGRRPGGMRDHDATAQREDGSRWRLAQAKAPDRESVSMRGRNGSPAHGACAPSGERSTRSRQ
jgi:hypothetical protein